MAKRIIEMYSCMPAKVLVIFLVFLTLGCEEETTGCRDIRATNYNVLADEDCEDSCCTYPQLSIKITPKIRQTSLTGDTTLIFKHNTAYTLPENPNDTFSVQRVRAYMSDFRLIDATGNAFKTEDTIQVEWNEETVEVVDDFFFYNPDVSEYELGAFRRPETYSGLKFKLGLYPELKATDPDETLISELRKQSPDSLNIEPGIGYIAQRYVFFSPPSAADSTVLTIFNPMEVSLDAIPFAFVDGFDATLYLTLDYDKLFENIDFSDLSAADTANIVSNLPNAFTLDSLDRN